MIDKRNTQVNTVTGNYLVSGKFLEINLLMLPQLNKVYNNTPDAFPTVIVS